MMKEKKEEEEEEPEYFKREKIFYFFVDETTWLAADILFTSSAPSDSWRRSRRRRRTRTRISIFFLRPKSTKKRSENYDFIRDRLRMQINILPSFSSATYCHVSSDELIFDILRRFLLISRNRKLAKETWNVQLRKRSRRLRTIHRLRGRRVLTPTARHFKEPFQLSEIRVTKLCTYTASSRLLTKWNWLFGTLE